MFTLKPKWAFSNKAFEAAVKKIDEECKLNQKYDVPFLAGYSKDGKTRYIDKEMPEGFSARGGYVKVIPFLLLHEGIEKCLIDYFKLDYDDAHEIAQHCEQTAVKIKGVNSKEYNTFMDQQISNARNKKVFHCPPDLDMTPYKDYPAIVKRMKDLEDGD